jgi:hypothetical protein
MRRLALMITLACVLSGLVQAGEIHTTGAIATPTPSPTIAYGGIPTTSLPTAVNIPGTGATVPLTIILTIISIVP